MIFISWCACYKWRLVDWPCWGGLAIFPIDKNNRLFCTLSPFFEFLLQKLLYININYTGNTLFKRSCLSIGYCYIKRNYIRKHLIDFVYGFPSQSLRLLLSELIHEKGHIYVHESLDMLAFQYSLNILK